MSPGPDALEVVCETPGRDAARFAFDVLEVRVRASAPVVHVEARMGGRAHALAPDAVPGPASAPPASPASPTSSLPLPFSARIPTAGLTRGHHAITVVARDAAGREAEAVTEVDVQPFAEMPPSLDAWPALVAAGHPVVHLLGCAPADPRPGWPAPVAVTGFAYCTQGLARLSLVVDGQREIAPFHGLYRPDLEAVLDSRAAVAAGFRGELLDLAGPATDHELVVLAVAPDGRAAGWRGPLPAPLATSGDTVDEATLPPLQPAPRRRADGASLAGPPPRGRHQWRQLAERWAERALRAEGEREAQETDRAWAGLQTRLTIERAADRELARRAAEELARRPIAFAPVTEPVVSVVVTVHDGAELTERCLRALMRSAGAVPFEVVVVDDGDDPAVAALLDGVEGIRVVRNATSLGYLRSANGGAEAARGTHVVQLNNDTEPQPGWLDALVDRLRTDDDVGVVAAKLLFPDGRLQEAGSIVWSDGQGWNYGIGEDETAPEYNVVRDVDYGSAAALLVRGSLWRDLGGFDERFSPAYYEDVDLCFSARARGLRVVYEPAARVVHARGGSMGADALDVSRDLIDAHRATFCRKWADALTAQHAYHPDRVREASTRGRPS